MATAIIAGIAAFSAAGGVAAGMTAVAWGAAAAAGSMILEQAMTPDMDMDTSEQAVSLDSRGTPIDKSTVQKESDLGKLKLGEDDKKKKRKKGKAAFKIELDEKKQADTAATESNVGVQTNTPEQQGIQL
jgi:hypothetical protein